MRRRNPLTQRPPQHFHRLKGEHDLARLGWPEPWVGINVADNPSISAGYAASAFEKNGYAGFPVVLAIDTRGLPVDPDVDALIWWYEREGIYQAREIVNGWPYDDMGQDDWGGNIIRNYLLDYLPRLVDWEPVADDTELIRRALKNDHDAIREILLSIFPQRRVMADIDWNRVVNVRSFKPWIEEVVWGVFEDDDEYENLPEGAVTRDELDYWEPAWIELYQASAATRFGRRGDIYYHGSTSILMKEAFPEHAELFEGDWVDLVAT